MGIHTRVFAFLCINVSEDGVSVCLSSLCICALEEDVCACVCVYGYACVCVYTCACVRVYAFLCTNAPEDGVSVCVSFLCVCAHAYSVIGIHGIVTMFK